MNLEYSHRQPEQIDTNFILNWNGKPFNQVGIKINIGGLIANVRVLDGLILSDNAELDNILGEKYMMYKKNNVSPGESKYFFGDPVSNQLLPDYNNCLTLKKFLEKMIKIRLIEISAHSDIFKII